MPYITAPAILLESRLGPLPGGRLYSAPVEIISAQTPDQLPECWARLEAGRAQGRYAAGYFSYELGYCEEPHLRRLLPEALTTPLLWFGLFERPRDLTARELDAIFGAMTPPDPLTNCALQIDEAAYRRSAETILDHIGAGDVYQVNLTFPIAFQSLGDPLRLYAALRARQPVAHGGVVLMPDRSILSVSPELFVETDGDSATMRPMKGTASRGIDAEDDARRASDLLASPKERAENLMIVDLLRNDLSRVAVPGSVQVPELFTLETYPKLHTLTSTVTARLNPRLTTRQIFTALFPCGSIVGAPKHRAAEVIRILEATPRGVYTGAIGEIHPDGHHAFSVAIRTAVIDAQGRGSYGVGSGLVADSDPSAEWRECLLKAEVLTGLAQDFRLIETFGWMPHQGFVNWERHLARMVGSADKLGFRFHRDDLRIALTGLAATLETHSRIRIELRRDGTVDIGSAPFQPDADRDLRVMIAATRLDAGDPYLRHKTSWRPSYEAAYDEALAAGCDEAVLLNQYGDVAEASRNTIFVQASEGGLLTPPLDCGVLPGVLRQQLIDTGRAREAMITSDMLRDYPWFVGNSLRGLRSARLVA